MQNNLEVTAVKIDWYREVLSMEPSSKVFLPFARLLVQKDVQETLQEAVSVLRTGLIGHPEFIEARLFYIELLNKLDRKAESSEQVACLSGLLKDYPTFWTAWGEDTASSSLDLSVSLSFLGALLQNENLTFTQILQAGLNSIKAGTSGLTMNSVAHNASSNAKNLATDYENVDPSLKTKPVYNNALQSSTPNRDTDLQKYSLRTRSMAEVLAEQEDYAGALDIYQELLNSTQSDDIESLMSRIQHLQSKLGSKGDETSYLSQENIGMDDFSNIFSENMGTENIPQENLETTDNISNSVSTDKLTKKTTLDFLNRLATRLEAKAQ